MAGPSGEVKRTVEREASSPEDARETVTSTGEGSRKKGEAAKTNRKAEEPRTNRKAGSNNKTKKPGEGAEINMTMEAEEGEGEEGLLWKNLQLL